MDSANLLISISFTLLFTPDWDSARILRCSILFFNRFYSGFWAWLPDQKCRTHDLAAKVLFLSSNTARNPGKYQRYKKHVFSLSAQPILQKWPNSLDHVAFFGPRLKITSALEFWIPFRRIIALARARSYFFFRLLA